MSYNPRFACPCCGYLTLSDEPPGTYEVCPVCDWEDDAAQSANAEIEGGANAVSLGQARANFREFGAAQRESLDRVRKPLPEEVPRPT